MAVWDGSIAAGFAGGDGTKESPYKISDGAQLAYLAQVVNVGNNPEYNSEDIYYELTNDIYLNDTSNWKNWNIYADADDAEKDGIRSWTPIGLYYIATADLSAAFMATFDGCDYVIRGIYIHTAEPIVNGYFGQYFQGLFGVVHSVGTVKNVGVEQSYLHGLTIGGIAGKVNGTLNGCYNSGDISGERVGGVAGSVGEGVSRLINCYNAGTVLGTEVGGVAGYVGGIYGKGYIINCYNVGAVSVTGDNYNLAGGVVGYVNNGYIINCYNAGQVTDVSGNCFIGGLSGAIYEREAWINYAYYLEGSAGSGVYGKPDKPDILKFNIKGEFFGNDINSVTMDDDDTECFSLLDALNAWVEENQTDPVTYVAWIGAPFPGLDGIGTIPEFKPDPDKRGCNGGSAAVAGLTAVSMGLAIRRRYL
ncbi:MAG: hypothetical protein FWE62_00525 [Firmicutes bacterium]|nr:hypothetical protein [Bacillota bacterium]